ncbi:MAG TPA: M42 family metallopeptidase [Candidatus Hydrothermia bacterium]|nr:M42 family metallopeptidase [Candidatus Hydrothermae bacterium]MDD3649764.1 M42 family metallopeptidase [Candidatus Hydrothermia bacterium]MDD5573072.1 M42 family metallopeptidase [Candidatus Hydrothermia bacterium]HOK23705.1 M42 family metallopeptidase [Candidatus Hydrothermia bacterium]HOL24414.1 M42 family metallopeptidase [Candidatus Hydrothermia bacterium]
MNTKELLVSLSNVFGPAGFEDEVRSLIKELIEGFVDEVHEDTSGNLITIKRGTSNQKVMLDAHMDEVGLVISHIQSPFLKFQLLGGWDARLLPGQKVLIKTRSGNKISGVIGTIPPHVQTQEEMRKVFEVHDLFIDVGATSEEELLLKGITVGDPAVVFSPAELTGEDTVIGKAFDDRAGCAVLIKLLERLKNSKLPYDLYTVFATGEELGLRGAKVSAYNVDPDFSLSLEGTIAVDNPNISPYKQPSHLGKGPVITIVDRSIVVNQKVVMFFEEVAKRNSIPYQYKTPIFGSTNAGVIHLERGGVLCGVIAVPVRYIHSPLSIVKVADFEYTVDLLYNILIELPGTGFLNKKLRL